MQFNGSFLVRQNDIPIDKKLRYSLIWYKSCFEKNDLKMGYTSVPVQTLEHLQDFAIKLADQISIPTAILLYGQMGCGKTQLTQFIVSALKASHQKTPSEDQDINVTSPTFTLHNTYHLNSFDVEHFDLFRLKNDADLESIGLWEIIEQGCSVLIIEWAERLEGVPIIPLHLQKVWQRMDIEFTYKEDDSSRYLQFHTSSRPYSLF